MKTIDDVKLNGKLVFCRVDLNSPVVDGKVEASQRIIEHAGTLKELAAKGARVVALAHQGRKGDDDFLPLEQHYQILKGLLTGVEIFYIDDVIGERAHDMIKKLEPGEILLLDNVRELDDEDTKDTLEACRETQIVRAYEDMCEVFVLDALSIAHRCQPSIVGFYKKEAIAGRVLQREVEALEKLSKYNGEVTFLLGGAKPSDGMKIMKFWLKKAQGKVKFLLGGAIGNLFLMAKGHEIGQGTVAFLQKNKALESVEDAKKMIVDNPGAIVLPADVAYELEGKRMVCDSGLVPKEAGVLDIGERTIEAYCNELRQAKRVMVNGPMGVYEDERFAKGTEATLKTIASSEAFSLLGGGHTGSAIMRFGIPKDKFGYLSLSGKALIEFLCGKELVGLNILNQN